MRYLRHEYGRSYRDQDAHGNIEAIDDLAKILKVLTNKLQQSVERYGRDVPPALKAGVGELLSYVCYIGFSKGMLLTLV